MQDFCSLDCNCHEEPGIRVAEVVPIRDLEKVEIIGFHGALREVYFVQQLVQKAPSLKLLRITSKVEDHSLEGIEDNCPSGCEVKIVVVRG